MRASTADGNKGTGQQMCQDRILGSVSRNITHKGTKLILRLYLAQEKQGKCGRRWLREDIRDRSTSGSRRLSYWYGTFVSYGISSTMFKNKLYKYLLSTVHVFWDTVCTWNPFPISHYLNQAKRKLWVEFLLDDSWDKSYIIFSSQFLAR